MRIPQDNLFNKLDLLSLANKHELYTFVRTQGPRILSLVFDSMKVLDSRLLIWSKFMAFLYNMNKHHGALYTVKYLKACHSALQCYIGNSPVKDLAEIEAGYRFPGLVGGLPAIISRSDRNLIRSGNPDIIRYWFTLFSVYRILKSPFKPKLKTITAPYTGQLAEFSLQGFISIFKRELIILGAKPSVRELKITSFFSSWTSSPSSKYSWTGIFRDRELFTLLGCEDLLFNWIAETKSSLFFNYYRLSEKYQEWYSYLSKRQTFERGQIIGKLSFKEEGAGKLRIFALVDSITQTLLKPLHKSLSNILRIIPNDGTFDQNSSYWRCSDKMRSYGVAFSYDLSAATDRLPIELQKQLISEIYNRNIGSLWVKLLVDRDFIIPDNQYNIPSGPIRYAVGQPMGALSSWNMLALTHHLVVQYCYWTLHKDDYKWTHLYEVLGDDIVIFDKELATAYYNFMVIELGVEINLSKSVISHSGQAFEFAKRTHYKGVDVSGIPLKGFLDYKYSYSSASSLLLKMIDNRYLSFKRIVAISLPSIQQFRTKFNIRSKLVAKIGISLLASLVYNNKLSLRAYLFIILNPVILRLRNRNLKTSTPLNLNNWEGYPSFSILKGLVSFYSESKDSVELSITLQPIWYSFLLGIEAQLREDIKDVYDRWFNYCKRLKGSSSQIYGLLAMGIKLDSLPSWFKPSGIELSPLTIRERYGAITNMLGLVILHPQLFESKFNLLKRDQMSIPILEDNNNPLLLVPFVNLFSNKEMRGLNPTQLDYSYETVNDLLGTEVWESLINLEQSIVNPQIDTLSISNSLSTETIFLHLAHVGKLEDLMRSGDYLFIEKPEMAVDLTKKLNKFTVDRIKSIKRGLVLLQK